MAKISLYLDTRKKNSKNFTLKVRIHLGGITRFVLTDIRMLPEIWDAERSSVMVTDKASLSVAEDVAKLKEILQDIDFSHPAGMTNEQIVDYYRDRITDRLQLTRNKFSIDCGKKTIDPARLVLSAMRTLRDAHKRRGTWEVYDRTVKSILVFDPAAEVKTFEDIDYAWLKSFEAHCKERGMKVNSIAILMRNIRATFNEAIRNDVTNNYPFKKYSIKQEDTKKRSLSLDQLRKLASMKLEPWQEEYRDMFFLSFMLLGINMGDLLSLKPSAMKDGRIYYGRAKTGTEYSIKVEPEALFIINKYRGSEYLLAPMERYGSTRDYIAHMNKALKAAGRKLGKQGRVLEDGPFAEISSYWARHSWATMAYEAGVPVDIIAQGLGHKNREHRITMVYIRQDTRKVDEANRLVLDVLLGVKKSEPAVEPVNRVNDSESAPSRPAFGYDFSGFSDYSYTISY